jgi:hypothetical protein
MASSSGNISNVLQCNELPNPFTPMAFLPPNMAVQAKVSEFLITFSLAVCFSIDCMRLLKLCADQM